MEEKYIVALEIGSSKIKGAIGTVDPSGSLSVKAVEEEKLSDSVRYGCIRNVMETANAIRNVIDRLEIREPGRKIIKVYVSVGGRSLMSQSADFERRLPTEMEITNEMISDIVADALNYQLHERTIVGVAPKEFRVDNSPTNNAVGMFGSLVTARLNLISCRSQLVRTLNLVLEERLHLTINDVFIRQLVEADLVLYHEEKRQGCMLVDLGSETTTVSIYKNGVLQYLNTIPLGSRNITRDITALNILEERADELKIDGGNALSSTDPVPNAISTGVGVDFNQINNYVAARAGEIVANINEQIKYAGFTPDKLPAGIILIGRGAKLNGFDRRLENLTTMKVRFGSPANRIRIIDGRINSTDHVDVISILSAVAKERDIQECMTRPVATQIPVQEPLHPTTETIQTPAAAPLSGVTNVQPQQYQPQSTSAQQQPIRPAQQPQNIYQQQAQNIRVADTELQPSETVAIKSGRGKGGITKILNNIKNRFVDLMTEPEEDDEPEN